MDRLNEFLRDDEKLLWSGKAESFTTLDNTHKSFFIRKSLISVLIGIVVLALYYVAAVKNEAEIMPAVILIIVFFSVFPSLNFFIDASTLRKKVLYAVTDKRMFIVRDSASSLDYSAVDQVSFISDADGHVSLICGENIRKLKPEKCRTYTIVGAHVDLDTGKCDNFAMYAVPDPDKLKAVLSGLVPVVG